MVNFDGWLYHYTRWETLLEIIHSRSILMNTIERMNDPRESKDWIVGTSHTGPPDLTGIDTSEVLREVASYRQHLKLVALSEDVKLESSPILTKGQVLPDQRCGHTMRAITQASVLSSISRS